MHEPLHCSIDHIVLVYNYTAIYIYRERERERERDERDPESDQMREALRTMNPAFIYISLTEAYIIYAILLYIYIERERPP